MAALFAAVCGPVGYPDMPGVFWRGLRMVAIDGTGLHVPDRPALRAVHAKRRTRGVEFGYPLLRLVALVECGTRALIGAVFGPECDGEGVYARGLVDTMSAGMLVLADAGFDDWQLLADITATGAQYLVRSSARRIPLILDGPGHVNAHQLLKALGPSLGGWSGAPLHNSSFQVSRSMDMSSW